MSNVYNKLLKVQRELRAPKSQYNSFGKYAYRSCEDILEALKPLFTETKSTVILKDKILLIGDRYYLESTAIFIDTETGETIENTALAREDETKKGMDLAQVTGSVSSYARKYALNGLFAIDDNKDSDATNKHGKDKDKDKEEIISEAQQKRLMVIGKGKDVNKMKEIISKHGFKSSKEITKSKYDKICEEIESI